MFFFWFTKLYIPIHDIVILLFMYRVFLNATSLLRGFSINEQLFLVLFVVSSSLLLFMCFTWFLCFHTNLAGGEGKENEVMITPSSLGP